MRRLFLIVAVIATVIFAPGEAFAVVSCGCGIKFDKWQGESPVVIQKCQPDCHNLSKAAVKGGAGNLCIFEIKNKLHNAANPESKPVFRRVIDCNSRKIKEVQDNGFGF